MPTRPTDVNEYLDDIQSRCEAVGWACEVARPSGDSRGYFRISFPQGRDTRTRTFSTSDARGFAAVGFEDLRYLGSYVAVFDLASGVIEAHLVRSQRKAAVTWETLELYFRGPSVPLEPEPDDQGEDDGGRSRRGKTPTKRYQRGDAWLELGPPTPVFVAAFGRTRGLTLRLPLEGDFRHDDAVAQLERIANAFLFDIDVRFGLAIALAQEPRYRVAAIRKFAGDPEYPANVYAAEPLALFRYGRAASGFPLLEFLAYYQALEHFFPYFAGQAVIQNLRSELKSPTFDFANDAMIARIISVAAPAVKSGGSEREQMRETIRAVVDEEILREFFSEKAQSHFSSKSGGIEHVGRLQFGPGSPDLRDQVAARLYDIRCRIVHAKSDGGPVERPVLLPDSAESHHLGPDIRLMRLVAERATIARARRVSGALGATP